MTEAHLAKRVATHIFEQGLARVPRPDDIGALIRTRAYIRFIPNNSRWNGAAVKRCRA